MFGGFSASSLKPQLKMAVSRIQIASNKKSALLKQNMREIACMLAEDPPKEEKAKIRAEALIRDDNLIEAYEILQLECELLHERIKLIEHTRECPPDLVPVVATLMWAAHRVDIPELLLIRKQFRAKYGKQFEDDALMNRNSVLNERVVTKLSVEPPAAYLVQTYLEKICEQFDVDWTPHVKLSTNQMVEPMAAPVGYSVQVAQGSGLGPVAYPVSHVMNGNVNNYRNDQDDDDPSKGGGGGGGAMSVPPVVQARPYHPQPLPPPRAPGHVTGSTGRTDGTGVSSHGDFEEVDIFVPAAPRGAPGSSGKGNNRHGGGGGGGQSVTSVLTPSPPSKPQTGSSTMTEDEITVSGFSQDYHTPQQHAANDAPAASSKAYTATSYDDLDARFQQLRK